ncbi:hypothetical protein J8L85_07390 [Maribacter sp. MMG018]|uniref:hypothetical protein n=1 Tax=Maribacter sp. MMG018 TaxID=2822688 RepID=UPI001B365ADD|nr:hypothetical protein [Maribacter sp. MMG018]MBQ4914254.1 hypothetical protein [Maribacter sp. MMG018]
MKKLLLLFTAIGLFSCNSHLDKPIFEPLTVNELKESIDSDSLFKDTYEYIVYIRDTILKTDMEKVKFADLTYEQVFDFAKFSSDTVYFKPVNERIEKEWNEKYGIYEQKVDSISDYWKKYKEENSIEQYVKVELARIDKEYYSYSGGIRNVNLGFRLTPLKGKIEQLRFGYKIEAKINEKDEEDIYSSIYSALDKSWCLTTSPFSKPVVRYWEASYTNEKILKNKTLETFNRDYNIYIEVDEIRKDGVNISNDDLNIPKSVINHWEYENKEYLEDWYINDIIEEVLGEEYMSKYDYRNQEIDKILKEKYPLVYEFIKVPMKKKELE